MTSQRFNDSQSFALGVSKESCSLFFILSVYLHVLGLSWYYKLQIYGPSFAYFASCVLKLCSLFYTFLERQLFSVEPRIDFSDKPFMGGREVHFS